MKNLAHPLSLVHNAPQGAALRCVTLRLLLVALRCVADARLQCLRLDARNASGHNIYNYSSLRSKAVAWIVVVTTKF